MKERNGTLEWYRENAEEFIERTKDVCLSEQYDRFLALLPPGGRVMDLGCGAGSAALCFARKGYDVLAVDGCRELCEFTRRRVGCPVRVLLFDDLDYEESFDGVWSCASLLHVGKADLPRVFRLIGRALKAGGVFYASFKYGESEREANGRTFTDLNEAALRGLLEEAGGFREIDVWTTADARPDRADERWLNLLCRTESVRRDNDKEVITI